MKSNFLVFLLSFPAVLCFNVSPVFNDCDYYLF